MSGGMEETPHGKIRHPNRYEAVHSEPCAPADHIWAIADYEKDCIIKRFKDEKEAKEYARKLNEEPVYCEDCFHFTRLCNKAVSDKVMYENCMGWRAKNDDPRDRE
jgi:hypothetical protein